MNPSDLIAVFDEYLKKSGVGKNYMADKIFKLFNNKNSPFNMDGKLIKNLENGIDDFTKKIKAFKIPNLNTFIKEVNSAVENVTEFRNNLNSTSFSAFNNALDGALTNVTEFRDNFKVPSVSAFNREMIGALTNVREFRANLNSTSFSAFNREMIGALTNVRDFRDNFKVPSFSAFNNALDGALTNVRDFRDNFKVPSFSAFKNAMDGALTNVKKFRDNLKVPSFSAFKTAMDGALTNVREFRDNLKVLNKSLSGGLGVPTAPEAAVGTSKIVNVRIVDISKNVEEILSRIFEKQSKENTTAKDNKDKDKEGGSFIGNIIKGILGTIALVAGIGFISSFLDTPMGKNIKAILGNLKDRFVEMITPFLRKLIDYSIEGLRVLFFELPKYFLKQTFNFFGLKEILGKENQGIAVLLTKGIYYGVKAAFIGVLNKFSFGGFSKLLTFIKPAIDFIPNTLGKIFSEIGDKLIGNLTKPFSILKNSFNIVKNSGATILGKIQGFSNVIKMIPNTILNFFKGFGAGGGIGKVLGSVAKLGGGSIFKLLGAGLKQIAKRIPFIGALISLKDAYDRFKQGDITGGLISIGSGLASFVPIVGTAISIGLDVLNAVLDKKSEGGKTSKLSIIGDFITDISLKLFFTLKEIFGFIGDVLDMLNPLSWGKKLWDWATGKEEDLSKELEKRNKKSEPKSEPKPEPKLDAHEILAQQRRMSGSYMPQKIGDGIVTKNKLIVPSSSDDVVAAKNGGPFDLAFKEMNAKLEQLLVIFAQGTQLIANSTMQGSSNVVQAVVSTGGKQVPVMIGGDDPIADFRQRANKSVG
jgi:hypothetical protein